MEHDKFCSVGKYSYTNVTITSYLCDCPKLEMIRADERERITQILNEHLSQEWVERWKSVIGGEHNDTDA